ncbi:hypothetical protein [Amycolatopsis sp. La24]|uniref:hypothetical protein n=1 Tax=Amycolatopsis sp. La24 TaxID=3028304 RepID=UPI0023AEBA05|nr:hypothetical protein [Amycolatopsis sp. La24]
MVGIAHTAAIVVLATITGLRTREQLSIQIGCQRASAPHEKVAAHSHAVPVADGAGRWPTDA